MREVDLEAWHEFFVASAGAAAALAGLAIVAISVNVERILKYPQLPPGAAATVAALVLVLAVSVAGLADQSTLAFGSEVLGLGAVAWYLQARASLAGTRADRQNRRPRSEAVVEVLTGQVQLLPFLVAGCSLSQGRRRPSTCCSPAS